MLGDIDLRLQIAIYLGIAVLLLSRVLTRIELSIRRVIAAFGGSALCAHPAGRTIAGGVYQVEYASQDFAQIQSNGISSFFQKLTVFHSHSGQWMMNNGLHI